MGFQARKNINDLHHIVILCDIYLTKRFPFCKTKGCDFYGVGRTAAEQRHAKKKKKEEE